MQNQIRFPCHSRFSQMGWTKRLATGYEESVLSPVRRLQWKVGLKEVGHFGKHGTPRLK